MANNIQFPCTKKSFKKRDDYKYKPFWARRALSRILAVMRNNPTNPDSIARLQQAYGKFSTETLERRFMDTIEDNPAACKYYTDYIKIK